MQRLRILRALADVVDMKTGKKIKDGEPDKKYFLRTDSNEYYLGEELPDLQIIEVSKEDNRFDAYSIDLDKLQNIYNEELDSDWDVAFPIKDKLKV